ncbi:DUF3817 domain-containing protein [Stackebrandtia nassauensis]|uniref:Putative transmembrane protein n=1 Tax=Stackebrandtia nassauensis (strain DSM 44728 / CIP 108903 / NRRL B-16338 / NBRC 102104 / LLR-40K-21) TaxID=446470 RepID=D3Q9P4_STANL|nr:DUF3817 domain-containing protein [Stackebrandtia nassauensis]ADD44590.1 putative transmembrane protein [Stackebrandtia nassauensis DSM 44728]
MPGPYRLFIAVAIAEAVSWVGLLIGMYFKHYGGGNEIGVKIFGPVHGVLFMGYVTFVLVLARQYSWSAKRVVAGLVCSIPPLASIGFERWVARDFRARKETRVPVGV